MDEMKRKAFKFFLLDAGVVSLEDCILKLLHRDVQLFRNVMWSWERDEGIWRVTDHADKR